MSRFNRNDESVRLRDHAPGGVAAWLEDFRQLLDAAAARAAGMRQRDKTLIAELVYRFRRYGAVMFLSARELEDLRRIAGAP